MVGEQNKGNWMDPAMFWLQVEKAGGFFPFSHKIILGVFLSVGSQVLLMCLKTLSVITQTWTVQI